MIGKTISKDHWSSLLGSNKALSFINIGKGYQDSSSLLLKPQVPHKHSTIAEVVKNQYQTY